MKTTNQRWNINLGLLLLSAAAGTVWAVNPDQASPCWRDAANSSRQVWTFDTTNSFGTAIASSFKTNQPGNPTATLTRGNLGQDWYDTGCGGPCGTVITAFLPLLTTGFDTNADPNPANWDQGPPYVNNQGGSPPYLSPPALGDAQGFWDMGGTSNRVVVTLPNAGAPAGTLRYFIVQGTYMVASGVASLPAGYAVTNSALTSGVRIGSAVNTTVEQPLDANGDKTPTAWRNQRVVLRVAADPAAGSDTITITNPTAFWVDAIIVEVLDRVAVNDVLNAVQNTVTNIPFAQLLANDRGGSLIKVGTAFGGSVVTNPGNIVTFTPSNGFSGAATFWYTNRDCTLYTNLGAQVTVNVASVNNPPVATNDFYSRPRGSSLKIKISDLLSNDTDPDGDTPLTVTNITLVTTNGVNISSNGNLLTYTNSATTDANDRLSYTITDGHGGSATAFVFITVTTNVTGQATGSITVSNNQVNLVFYGIPGTAYQLQRSTNAGSTWLTFSNKTANAVGTPPVGQISVTDNFSGVVPIPSSALYRLFLP